MTNPDRLTMAAFDALAYELADAAQRLRVHHIAARALTNHPGLTLEYAIAAEQVRSSLFAALSSLEQAADTMLTEITLVLGLDNDPELDGRPIVTAELPVDGPL